MGFDFSKIQHDSNTSLASRSIIDAIHEKWKHDLRQYMLEWKALVLQNNMATGEMICNGINCSVDPKNTLAVTVGVLPPLLRHKDRKIFLVEPNFIERCPFNNYTIRGAELNTDTAVICSYGDFNNTHFISDKFIDKLFFVNIKAKHIIFQLSYKNPDTLKRLYEWINIDAAKYPDRIYTFIYDDFYLKHYTIYYDEPGLKDDKGHIYEIWKELQDNKKYSIKQVMMDIIKEYHHLDSFKNKIKNIFNPVKMPNVIFSRDYVIDTYPKFNGHKQ